MSKSNSLMQTIHESVKASRWTQCFLVPHDSFWSTVEFIFGITDVLHHVRMLNATSFTQFNLKEFYQQHPEPTSFHKSLVKESRMLSDFHTYATLTAGEFSGKKPIPPCCARFQSCGGRKPI